MSLIVKFFVAPDDPTAASVLLTGPRHAFESLSVGNFDPERAVVEWECFLVGGSFEELVKRGEPRDITVLTNDGSFVFAVSPRLAGALAEAEPSVLAEAAVSWTAQQVADGEDMDVETVEGILVDLAALIRSARRQGHSVYCWVA